MAEHLTKLKKAIEGSIDFPSQRFTENLSYEILTIGTILSFVVGYKSQSLENLIYGFISTIVVTLVVVVPNYPLYNKEKVEWLEPVSIKLDTLE